MFILHLTLCKCHHTIRVNTSGISLHTFSDLCGEKVSVIPLPSVSPEMLCNIPESLYNAIREEGVREIENVVFITAHNELEREVFFDFKYQHRSGITESGAVMTSRYPLTKIRDFWQSFSLLDLSGDIDKEYTGTDELYATEEAAHKFLVAILNEFIHSLKKE